MISIGVWVDLYREPAGGHVKCWERFAEAATTISAQLDLTVHFLGDQEQTITLASNVRYILHRPRFSTKGLPFLKNVPGHTDLVSYNPSLLPHLHNCDIVHTTHPLFSFGKTALRYCCQTGKPLVSSVHTDTPQYSQIFMEQTLCKMFGPGFLSRLLNDRLQLPRRYRQQMERQLQHHWQTSTHVLVSQPSDREQVAQVLPGDRISHLRRGIDRRLFSPRYRDRQALAVNYGVPADRFLLLFVGRLDACKNVMTFAHSARLLLERGIPIHALAVGQGSSAPELQAVLGDHVTLTGSLPQTELGPIFASADLFVFPSQTETLGNVVVEAKACGLPVLVSADGGAHQVIQSSGQDGVVVPETNPNIWADQIEQLYHDPIQLAHMRQATQEHMAIAWPTWETILLEDLLPVWSAVKVGHSLGTISTLSKLQSAAQEKANDFEPDSLYDENGLPS